MEVQFKNMNRIDYKFTKKEVEAVAKLLIMARNFNLEGKRLSKIIAVAFNREALKSIFNKDNK